MRIRNKDKKMIRRGHFHKYERHMVDTLKTHLQKLLKLFDADSSGSENTAGVRILGEVQRKYVQRGEMASDKKVPEL